MIVLIIYKIKEQFVRALTSIPEVHEISMSLVFYLILNSFPEQFKGINKGLIRGLNLQGKAVWIHIVGNWALNMSMQYYLLVVKDYGVKGIWYSKITMEIFIVICQTVLIEFSDWEKIMKESFELQKEAQ